ncbi:uncharacterized protein [Parasteatoda tepidariorum]|uniref:uncharacterized protein n=1 Tax=Parasteatoda tepidariorum TaxID=114398 RepID=UPI001C71E201|nr:uncharacterized protein LOC107441699 [Parasteatoda tepidariorum]XP_042903123.1 uncharacterized protein LOC107441699 [Parasteatoda tepidariorum]
MDDPPPSYSSLFNDHASGISYIDFLPFGVKESFLSKPICDRFGKLIENANRWLRLNPQWEIVTCESVEFKDKGGQILPTKMSYYENTKTQMSFIRGLRLWLKTVPAGQERIKKIGYRNLVPQTVSSAGMFTHAKYETLDDILRRFNTGSRTSHLPGRIITIETQGMKIKSGGAIDPDRSRWTEFDGRDNRFIYIIRIFYEICDPLHETIGITDFVPECRSSGLLNQEYEPFSAMFDRASSWCSRHRDLRISNMQTLSTKVQGGINPRKMSYTEHEGRLTLFVKILRVAYIRQKFSPTPIRYSCKTFAPAQLQSSSSFSMTFETLQQTMKKVSDWIQHNKAEVINMETAVVRLSSKGPTHSANKSHYYDRGTPERYIFIIRAYFNGCHN